MVSKRGGKVQQQQGLVSAGKEGGSKASGCQAGRRAGRERGCRSKLSRRLESGENLGAGGAGSQLGCHVSPALRTLSHWGTG